METYEFIVSVILVFLPFIDWTAFTILHRAAKDSDSISLNERARVALILATATSMSAFLGATRILQIDIGPLLLIVLSLDLILISLPNLIWLWLYVKKIRGRNETHDT